VSPQRRECTAALVIRRDRTRRLHVGVASAIAEIIRIRDRDQHACPLVVALDAARETDDFGDLAVRELSRA
jgi:hypothetical protein